MNKPALGGLAVAMDRRRADLEQARVYLRRYARLGGEGLINQLLGEHDKILTEIDAFLGRAAERYAAGFSIAVTEAGVAYARTDARASARTDAALPDVPPLGAGPARADPRLGSEVFDDRLCPHTRYAPPPDHRAEWSTGFDLLSVASPTSIAREMIWKATRIATLLGLIDRPVDVLELAVRPLAGDWAGFLTCADVFENIAAALLDCAGCVEASAQAVPPVWTGHAADRCAVGLRHFAQGLAAGAPALLQTAAAYRRVAATVKAESQLICTLITTATDLALEISLSAVSDGWFAPVEMFTEASDLLKVVRTVQEVAPVMLRLAQTLLELMEAGCAAARSAGVVQDSSPIPGLAGGVPVLPSIGAARPVAV